jgi:hypothetical protein
MINEIENNSIKINDNNEIDYFVTEIEKFLLQMNKTSFELCLREEPDHIYTKTINHNVKATNITGIFNCKIIKRWIEVIRMHFTINYNGKYKIQYQSELFENTDMDKNYMLWVACAV